MNENKDMTNTPLYKILTYITDLLLSNICFLLVISPILIYISGYSKESSLGILLLISILLGPAFTTLFSVMGKLVREKEIAAVRDFFHFYKINFFQGLIVSIIVNSALAVCYFDMTYFKGEGNNFMANVFLLGILAISLISLYIYPLISRYNMKIIHAIKISVRLMITKFYISFTCIAMIVIVLFIIKTAKIALLGVLLGASIIAYLIMYLEDNIIYELEEEIKNKYRN
ncbi:Uncharacterized membrane protein YesL [Clostridium sp. DSM 8431]|uniref:DUF624 domain-containing protein n=1 Tax=Clostridium sp. DSM 8431 TaxID=1761781 RepID=UPI0008DFFEFD|nr:DUF624 domain-containing protein [Clostridium sp. DSM 8431]SFU39806.1 Uncharacterized membrane protein YesL [Clostridium sp. DSM 8431]